MNIFIWNDLVSTPSETGGPESACSWVVRSSLLVHHCDCAAILDLAFTSALQSLSNTL